MGFLKITSQDSVKSIISNQSIESNGKYTCTCGGRDTPTGPVHYENGENIKAENSCVHRKMVQLIFLYLLGALAFIPCGASIAWSSNFLFSHWNDSQFLSTSTSWIVASLPLTAAFTSLVIFKLVHKVGVRLLLLSSILTMALSWLLIFLQSYHILILFAGRVLGGVGMGSIYTIVPKYMEDLTSVKTKKIITQFMYGATIIGAMFQYASDYWSNDLTAIIMIVVSIISVIGFSLFPESPHTLVRKQLYVDARSVLQEFLADKNENEIISKMQNWTICEQRGDASFGVMFKRNWSWVEDLVPVFGLVIFDALLGVTAILFYLKPIVFGVGEGVLPVTIEIIIISCAMLLGICLKSCFCNCLNTKSSLLLSIFIIFLNYGLLGTYYHTTNLGITILSDNYPYIPLICFATIALIYTCGVLSNIQTFLQALTLHHNRFAVRSTSNAIFWMITAILCIKLNHVIWYIGIGWLFYNMAIVSMFMMVFIVLLMPRLIKEVLVIDVASDGSEVSSSGSSERSKVSISHSTSTDITMDNVLVV